MKQEPVLYWCLFHSALNTELKAITSNWLNFTLVLQEPQKVQMRAGEPSLLIYNVCESTLTSLIFEEKMNKMYFRIGDSVMFWPHQAKMGIAFIKMSVECGQKQKTGMLSSWVRNYLEQCGQVTKLFVFLSPQYVSSLNIGVNFSTLQQGIGQGTAKGQNLNAHNSCMHPGNFMTMKC